MRACREAHKEHGFPLDGPARDQKGFGAADTDRVAEFGAALHLCGQELRPDMAAASGEGRHASVRYQCWSEASGDVQAGRCGRSIRLTGRPGCEQKRHQGKQIHAHDAPYRVSRLIARCVRVRRTEAEPIAFASSRPPLNHL